MVLCSEEVVFFFLASLHKKVLNIVHGGHKGIVKTKKTLLLKVWWLGIDQEAKVLCRKCVTCQLVSGSVPPACAIYTNQNT